MIAARKLAVSDAATTRPLAVRRRLDIAFKPVIQNGRKYWHLKDPVSLRYWQFGEEEFFLWQQLVDQISLSDWQNRFREEFAPRRIDTVQLQYFLGMLHREGLVISDAAGQAEIMLERRATLDRRQRFAALTNLLAIRFRGIDPEPVLSRIYAIVRGLFHPFAMGTSLLLILSAVLLVLTHWSDFVARLPDNTSFFGVQAFCWFAVALASTKILHEFGHALTNKHFGGECRELGVLLLVFTPCLYCNVSDTWLNSDKWKRIAVSAAGMYVDLVLAAACTWLWWYSVPGVFHSLCFSVMVVGSIGTLFANGNPLLRYDGYFILSDWLEIPNLKAEADSRLRHLLFRYLLGMNEATQDDSPSRHFGLLVYAVASSAYRLVVFVLVMWFVYLWFDFRRLEGVGVLLVAIFIAGAVVPIVWQVVHELNQPRRTPSRVMQRWLVWTTAIGVLATLLLIPLPRRVTAPISIVPRDAVTLYVSVPGRIVEGLEPGAPVTAGQQIARLENSELDFKIVQLTAERDELRKVCEVLKQQQIQDFRGGIANTRAQLPIAQQSLHDIEKQLELRLAEREQLVIRAPCDGVLVARRPKPRTHSDGELPAWQGSPLATMNQGCYVESGDLLGYVVASSALEATILLDQSEVDQIEAGQAARIQIDEVPGRTFEGKVSAVSASTVEDLPPELVAKGWFGSGDTANQKRRHKLVYQARASVDQPIATPWGSSGRAKIAVRPQSSWHRALETLQGLFWSHTCRFAAQPVAQPQPPAASQPDSRQSDF